MKLRRLKIIKFRNVQPGTEIEFNDGYNVLLGQNGSGKTTLLRLITSVLRGDFVWLEKEAFSIEADLEASVGRVALMISNERKARDDQALDILPSELRGFVPKSDGSVMKLGIYLTTLAGDVWKVNHDSGRTTFAHPGVTVGTFMGVEVVPMHKVFLYAFGVWISSLRKRAIDADFHRIVGELNEFLDEFTHTADACRFDESLELFSAVTCRRTSLGQEEYASVPDQINTGRTKKDEKFVIAGMLVPMAIRSSEALENPQFSNPVNTVVINQDQAPFLAKVIPLLGYVGAEIKLDLLGKAVSDDEQTLEYGNLRFFFHGRDGSIVNQDHLSYGQKRLLTFFYYLACNSQAVVADELVNGLHHAWIAECIQAMGDRQVFVTSQNPVLLDHLGFDSAEHVRRTFITCQSKPEGVRDRLTWANMSKKNADSFYRAYKVGAQHVGEILRSKGFW